MKKSIQWQLIFVICSAFLVSFTIFILLMRYFMIDDYKTFVQINDLQTAQNLAGQVEQRIARPLRRVHILALYPSFMGVAASDKDTLTRRFSFDENLFELVSVFDANGVESIRFTGKLTPEQAQKILRENDDSKKLSSTYRSAVTNELIFTSIEKIEQDGKLQGTVIANISLRPLQKFLQDFDRKTDLAVYLFDQDGTAIVQPAFVGEGIFNYNTLKATEMHSDSNGNVLASEKYFKAPGGLIAAMKAAQSGESGENTYFDENSNEIYSIYQPISLPISDAHWALVVTHSSSALNIMLNKLFIRSLLAGFVISILTIACIVMFSRRLTKPMHEIIAMANRVRAGDLSGQLSIKSDNEIGVLADNINHMIQGLRATRKKSKDAETKIKAIAYHDALTGLPNRTHFLIYLRQMIEKSVQSRFYGALLFIDVDKFKMVNDTYGHAVGDGLLIAFAKRIVDIAGRKEVACRFGGDEFLLFLLGYDETDTRTICEKLVKSMREPFEISGHKFSLSTSVGAALFPKDADNIDDLLERADAALYVSKRSGRDQYNFYVDGMETTPIDERD